MVPTRRLPVGCFDPLTGGCSAVHVLCAFFPKVLSELIMDYAPVSGELGSAACCCVAEVVSVAMAVAKNGCICILDI